MGLGTLKALKGALQTSRNYEDEIKYVIVSFALDSSVYNVFLQGKDLREIWIL